ncbi:MAG: hypothetical protein KA746_07990 [Pyrinomonadaceae bacterium]|nr:hypothetical protein [Pyrinomonadaceae bacterium]MBP6213263.1 hypothetical protein [Pyrinomonadaceae bacterium]
MIILLKAGNQKNLLIFGKVADTIHVAKASPKNSHEKTPNAAEGKVCPDRLLSSFSLLSNLSESVETGHQLSNFYATVVALKPPKAFNYNDFRTDRPEITPVSILTAQREPVSLSPKDRKFKGSERRA